MTQDTAAPHCLSSGLDQNKPAITTNVSVDDGQKGGYWTNNQIVENLEFTLNSHPTPIFSMNEEAACLASNVTDLSTCPWEHSMGVCGYLFTYNTIVR